MVSLAAFLLGKLIVKGAKKYDLQIRGGKKQPKTNTRTKKQPVSIQVGENEKCV